MPGGLDAVRLTDRPLVVCDVDAQMLLGFCERHRLDCWRSFHRQASVSHSVTLRFRVRFTAAVRVSCSTAAASNIVD